MRFLKYALIAAALTVPASATDHEAELYRDAERLATCAARAELADYDGATLLGRSIQYALQSLEGDTQERKDFNLGYLVYTYEAGLKRGIAKARTLRRTIQENALRDYQIGGCHDLAERTTPNRRIKYDLPPKVY